ncbi:MAG: hypothetical protein ACE37F_00770 [Nannocystaceae bacterium]|nr:hypothetical protein [bacterium]
MATEPQRDWNHFLVNTVLSAAVGAAVSHFLREHMGGKAQAERDAMQDRQADLLRQQQAQFEQLLRSTRARPFAPTPPPTMHGLSQAPAGYAHPYAHARPAYAPAYPALPPGGLYSEES